MECRYDIIEVNNSEMKATECSPFPSSPPSYLSVYRSTEMPKRVCQEGKVQCIYFVLYFHT
jgi:hypothetical protein